MARGVISKKSYGGHETGLDFIATDIPFRGILFYVNSALTLRLLMSYIYMEHLFVMFLDHTRRRSTVGRTPLDE